MISQVDTGIKEYATFRVADLFFGIEVLEVQEFLQSQQMTNIPLAPPFIAGLINLRGQIVTAIDMRHLLGLPARTEVDAALNIVVRSEDGPLSLLVDEIGDVVQVPPSEHEPVPMTFPSELRQNVTKVCKLDGRLLLVLDREQALQVSAQA